MVSFATDIRPLFRDIDINHMAGFFDLSSYDDVRANAQEILGRLKGTTGPLMPPGSPWPADRIGRFERWIADGFPA